MADDLGQTVADTLRSGFSLGKDLFKKTKNLALNVSEMEAKVKDATNGEAWGPSGTQLHELAMATGSQEDRAIIIQALIRRFGETPENWRKTYKALNVWEYCLKNGARRFVEDACDHDFEIRKCLNFAFIEADTGRDQGLNVRNRAKIISELMKDKARLDAERDKSKQARERFHNGNSGGISSTDVGGAGGGGRRAADFDEPSRRDDSPPRHQSAAEARPRVSGEFQRDAPTFASTERSSAPKAAAAAPKQPQQTVGSLLDFDSPAPAVAPKVSSMDFFSSAPAPAADAGGWANFGASNPAPAPAASLPPIQQFGGGTWDAFGAAPAPAPMQQFAAPASNDFGNFQSSEPAKPAVDKKVAGLIDMDDLLGAKKTETSSGAAGKGTPMNAMKPMGATKMGQGSGGGFGAQGAFGASPMMPMGGAPSMGMGSSAPMAGMGHTVMNPQMGGMGMVGFLPFFLCTTAC
jgi:epsin